MIDDSAFENAKVGVATDKAVSKGQDSVSNIVTDHVDFSAIKHIIFACDAGMGSSAMGASILRNKVKKLVWGKMLRMSPLLT